MYKDIIKKIVYLYRDDIEFKTMLCLFICKLKSDVNITQSILDIKYKYKSPEEYANEIMKKLKESNI